MYLAKMSAAQDKFGTSVFQSSAENFYIRKKTHLKTLNNKKQYALVKKHLFISLKCSYIECKCLQF